MLVDSKVYIPKAMRDCCKLQAAADQLHYSSQLCLWDIQAATLRALNC